MPEPGPEEKEKKAVDPLPPGKSGGGGSGCAGFILIFLLAGPLVVEGIWGFPAKSIWRLEWAILLGLLKLLLAFGVFGIGLLILAALVSAGKDSKGPWAPLLKYLGDLLPLGAFTTLFETIEQGEKQGDASGKPPPRNAVLASIVTCLVLIAAADGLTGFLGLPPLKMSATQAVYMTYERLEAEEPGKGKAFLEALNEKIKPANDSAGKTPYEQRRDALLYTAASGNLSGFSSPEEQAKVSMTAPGVSFLDAYLELRHDYRTANDLKDLVEAELSSDHFKAVQQAIDEWEADSLLNRVLRDAIYVGFILVYAILFWLLCRPKIRFPVAVSMCFLMWGTMWATETIVFLVSSFAVMLYVCQILSAITHFLVLQVWLLAPIPDASKVGPFRSFLVGTACYIGLLYGQSMIVDALLSG